MIQYNIGENMWNGEINVTALNKDNVVQLRSRAFQVYCREDDVTPLGVGINKRATVQHHGI